MLSRLSPLIYHEYARVYQLMTGQRIEENYKRLTETTIYRVFDNQIELNTPSGVIIVIFIKYLKLERKKTSRVLSGNI